jgi:hypothetical protein
MSGMKSEPSRTSTNACREPKQPEEWNDFSRFKLL